jgi:hypothetical protein
VNRSRFEFTVGGDRRIVYGLGAIKGVGRGVVEAIIAERDCVMALTPACLSSVAGWIHTSSVGACWRRWSRPARWMVWGRIAPR